MTPSPESFFSLINGIIYANHAPHLNECPFILGGNSIRPGKMKLEKILKEKRSSILEKWGDKVLNTYSDEAFKIFKNEKNQFANPIGHRVSVGLAALYDAILDSEIETEIPLLFEDFVLVRAVQVFTPSQAIYFIFQLKEIVREECEKAGLTDFYKDLLTFYDSIDAVTLLVFDLYMASRDRLYQVRIDELKSGAHIFIDGGCPTQLLREYRKNKRN